MYVPSHFDEPRLEVLHELVRSHPLATFITQVDNEIVVNHIPFFLRHRVTTPACYMLTFRELICFGNNLEGRKQFLFFKGPSRMCLRRGTPVNMNTEKLFQHGIISSYTPMVVLPPYMTRIG